MNLPPAEVRRRAWIGDALLNAYVVLRLERKWPAAGVDAWHRKRGLYVSNASMALLVKDLKLAGRTHAKGTFVESLLYNATDDTLNAYCEWIEKNIVF
jgi:dsRNA-specific ribonuclease